ncbi:MAG: putative glycoside hydrolase, partial [bacterium]|nr:putative glycoside hydrolase [bacterium]
MRLTRREFLGGFAALTVLPSALPRSALAEQGDDIRAAYLSSGQLENPAKVKELLGLIEATELNAIVIDVKDSKVLLEPRHVATLRLFKERGVYVIGRLITFQDSRLAQDRKDLAVRDADGGLFLDGNPRWRRYWVDPAAKDVQD